MSYTIQHCTLVKPVFTAHCHSQMSEFHSSLNSMGSTVLGFKNVFPSAFVTIKTLSSICICNKESGVWPDECDTIEWSDLVRLHGKWNVHLDGKIWPTREVIHILGNYCR